MRFFGSESAATISLPPGAACCAAAMPAKPVVAARRSDVLRSERRDRWTGDMIHSGNEGWAGLSTWSAAADLKTATSAVSTLIRGLYSNDFTLRGPLRKQYAFRRQCAFLLLRPCRRRCSGKLI
ncbi:exported hypothetical protein [Agrobacterium deltaense NCPPB 1641]|uniref:Uncharacterized protein n=1 Tax=Agrobacterium deltaense NCPPB 1641 TaxID=1183425 RepID=A0A1S7U2E4_9HYPH|nr:exported hypothetical protein [Agrobacterium deltaense NCPPB 1641]